MRYMFYPLLTLTAMSLAGCDYLFKEEASRAIEEEATCPTKLKHGRYSGFGFFVDCTGKFGAWLPPGEEEKVGQKVDKVLNESVYRCRYVKHVGIKTGNVIRYSDQKCETVPHTP